MLSVACKCIKSDVVDPTTLFNLWASVFHERPNVLDLCFSATSALSVSMQKRGLGSRERRRERKMETHILSYTTSHIHCQREYVKTVQINPQSNSGSVSCLLWYHFPSKWHRGDLTTATMTLSPPPPLWWDWTRLPAFTIISLSENTVPLPSVNQKVMMLVWQGLNRWPMVRQRLAC